MRRGLSLCFVAMIQKAERKGISKVSRVGVDLKDGANEEANCFGLQVSKQDLKDMKLCVKSGSVRVFVSVICPSGSVLVH